MFGVLEEVGLEASLREGLGGLDADEAGSEDDGSRARGLAQGEGVVDRAQGVHARGVEAIDGWLAREGSRGEDQVIIGEHVGLAGLSVGDLDAVRAGVDRRDLGVDAHVEVERGLEGLRGVEEELGGVFDLTADVVREPAVREGHVLTALQHDDLGALVAPAQARRRAHATGDSSDNYNSHVRLTFWLEDRSSSTVLRIPPRVWISAPKQPSLALTLNRMAPRIHRSGQRVDITNMVMPRTLTSPGHNRQAQRRAASRI